MSKIEIRPSFFVRYFEGKENLNSETFAVYQNDDDGNTIEYDENNQPEKNLIFIHPKTHKEFFLNSIAHQIRGINCYFIVSNKKNSVPIVLDRDNDKLVKKKFTPSDMYNKLDSKIMERELKKYQPRDKGLIYTVLLLMLLSVVITTIPFFPFLLQLILSGV